MSVFRTPNGRGRRFAANLTPPFPNQQRHQSPYQNLSNAQNQHAPQNGQSYDDNTHADHQHVPSPSPQATQPPATPPVSSDTTTSATMDSAARSSAVSSQASVDGYDNESIDFDPTGSRHSSRVTSPVINPLLLDDTTVYVNQQQAVVSSAATQSHSTSSTTPLHMFRLLLLIARRFDRKRSSCH